MLFYFRPALFTSLKNYGFGSFKADLAAGLTVGVVALPLAMAFAIASGVSPQAGIFTAIIAGFLISALGGSRFQIGGPTGAFVVIVLRIVNEHGIGELLLCTMASGVLLFAMGATRMGRLIRFIPVCIVIGFTNGIAVLIILSQINDFLGLQRKLPDEFFARMAAIYEHIGDANPASVVLALTCLAIILLWPKKLVTTGKALEAMENAAGSGTAQAAGFSFSLLYNRLRGTLQHWRIFLRIPAPLIVLVLASVVVALLSGVPGFHVETIGNSPRFDGIPQGFPEFRLPSFTWDTLGKLAMPTITITLLGAIESLLSARVADSMTGDRHEPNQELMAQGVANFVVPFFGGIPATGAIARTATNIRAGAQTPVSGMIHALTLLAIVLVAAPLASFIPLAALCAILLVVGLNMGDWSAFLKMRQHPLSYSVILVVTFVVTVVFDLTLAVELGLVLAALSFIFRASRITRLEPVSVADAPAGVVCYRLVGSLFFGAVDKIEPLLNVAGNVGGVVLLDLQQLLDADETGIDALSTLNRELRRGGGRLYLCGTDSGVREYMLRTDFAREIGTEFFVPDVSTALEQLKAARQDMQQEAPMAADVIYGVDVDAVAQENTPPAEDENGVPRPAENP